MVKTPNMWKLVGSWYVPDPFPVCNKQKWFGFGKFLVLALITTGATNPVSPVLIYVLLAHSQGVADPLDAMHLSLKFIKEIDEVQALVLLPWMTIARGQDWRQLPNPRRTQLLQMITGLEIDVSLRFVDQRWKNKPEGGVIGCQGLLTCRTRPCPLECSDYLECAVGGGLLLQYSRVCGDIERIQ